MAWELVSLISAISGLVTLFIIYAYLFIVDKKKFIAFWALSWVTWLFNYYFMLMIYKSSLDRLYILGSQVCFLLSSFFLIIGTYIFLNKKIPEKAALIFAVNMIWLVVSISQGFSFYVITIPVTLTLSFIHIWTGLLFLKNKNVKGNIELFVGSTFILWGLHQIDYPFINITYGFSPGAFFIAALLGVTSIAGVLILYIQVSRKELELSEERFRMLTDNAQDIVYRFELIPEARFEYVSPASEKMLGYSPEDFYRNPYIFMSIIHPEEKERFESFYKNPALLNKPVVTRIINKNGMVSWVEFRNTLTYGEDGELLKIEGIIRDVTEQKEKENEIKYLSFYDKLTNLYNRAFFEAELKRLDTERQLPLTIVVGDVNGLKLLNDTFGHKEGDRLLKIVSGIIKRSCRNEDIIARYGGDEFIILLPKTDKIMAQNITRRIKENIMAAMDEVLPISISLGLATKEGVNQSVDDVIKEAEDNMYTNKLMESKNMRFFLIETLEKKLSEKDYHDKDHIKRVKKLANEMGRKLGLSNGELEELNTLVALHDIGKISLPKDILLKEDRLSPSEMKTLQRHCEIGYRIACASAVSHNVADAILYHHENWDGSGYPYGLKEKQIPYISRIFAIVDAYDAMTNYRPYKKTLSHEEAVKELKNSAGTQFDPELVEVFVNVIDKLMVQ